VGGNPPVGRGVRLLLVVVGKSLEVLGERVRRKGIENDDGDRWQHMDTTTHDIKSLPIL